MNFIKHNKYYVIIYFIELNEMIIGWYENNLQTKFHDKQKTMLQLH